jgi:L-alanine-DL-glutamate epimerase-like enolase superfamily enzyme
MKLRGIRAATVELWRYKLDAPVGGSGVASVDVIVIGLEDDEGRTGLGFSYVLSGPGDAALVAARHLLETYVRGQLPAHPEAMHRRLRHSLNRTGKGPAYIGLAAIDVALWDLYAKQLDMPLGIAMGGAQRAVNVYGSGGFTATQDPEAAAEQARHYLECGVRAVKPRIGGTPRDLPLLARVREQLGHAGFMAVDANEKATATTAAWLLQAARDNGVLFLEEPLVARDLAGYRVLARAGVAIATGEHLQGLDEAAPFLAEGLCQVFQPDIAMMGGLTECLRVARMAEGLGVEISPHFLPNLFVHLAAAAPNVTWLEDFPLLEPLFGSPARFDAAGQLAMPDAAGHGLSWADGARESFRITST